MFLVMAYLLNHVRTPQLIHRYIHLSNTKKQVYQELSTRRLLVSEWVDGIKLTQAPQAEVRTYSSTYSTTSHLVDQRRPSTPPPTPSLTQTQT